jgi:hypothetical protein
LGQEGDLRGSKASDERRTGLVDWSKKEGLTELDPNMHGTGIFGAESKRKTADPDNWIGRTYFRVEGGGYKKEPLPQKLWWH